MKSVVIVLSLVPIFLGIFVTSFYGLDLRKWSDWRYGGINFLCGVVATIMLDGKLVDGLIVGFLIAFLTLYGGAMTRRHQIENKRMTKELLSQYENDELPPLLARLVKKLLDKYN